MKNLGLGLGWNLSAGGIAVPSEITAAEVPADSGLVLSSSLNPTWTNWSAGAWFRIDSMPEQYVSLFVIQKASAPGTNEYFWLGHDQTAGGGNRGLSVADNQGAHSYQLLPALGTWFHVGIVKNVTTVKVWMNGVLIDWDTAAPGVNYSATMGQSSYVNIDRLKWCNEGGVGQDFVGAIRSAWYANTALVDPQMEAMPQYGDPSDNYPVDGRWELPNGATLTGDPAALVYSGAAGGSTTGPSGIIYL